MAIRIGTRTFNYERDLQGLVGDLTSPTDAVFFCCHVGLIDQGRLSTGHRSSGPLISWRTVVVKASLDEQYSLLMRGVEQVVPEEGLRAKLERSLAQDRPLRVKFGIDPTGADVHLGHTVVLRKLRQFQDLGHTAVLIIGIETALVGDPSGRDQTRATLTRETIEENARDYLTQVGKIVDLDRAEIHRNSDWFDSWSFVRVLELCRQLTVGQVSQRDDFKKRLDAAEPVYLHECLYPLMQAHDSVEVRADVELGGTEQLFNLMLGRDLQKTAGQGQQVPLTMPILVGTDGQRKMGKSLDNYIGVGEDPENQFGKIMSVPDTPLRQYFTLLTDLPVEQIDHWLAPGVNPRDAKEALGKFIVTQYHGAEAAEKVVQAFRDRAKGQIEVEAVDVAINPVELDDQGCLPAPRLIVALGLRPTTSQARQVIEQGGVKLGEEPLLDVHRQVPIVDGMVVRIGKGNKQKAARVRIDGEVGTGRLA